MSSWSQGFLSFDPFQTLASSGILVFRSHQRPRGRWGSAWWQRLRLGGQIAGAPHPRPSRVWVAHEQVQVRVASGGAPPRGQRGQQGFMGKDLSAAEEDILPAFPSSCGRSPRPRFRSAGGPPLSQLGSVITPPILTPGRRGQPPYTAGCTRSCAALGAQHLPGFPSSPPRRYSGSSHFHTTSPLFPASPNCLCATPEHLLQQPPSDQPRLPRQVVEIFMLRFPGCP